MDFSISSAFWTAHSPKHKIRALKAVVSQWALEQMVLGIWPEQELSKPACSAREVIRSVPLCLKRAGSKGSTKKDLKFLLKSVLNLQDNASSLPLSYLKIIRNDIIIFHPPNAFGKGRNCSNLEISSPTPVTLISKPAWFCLKKEGLSCAFLKPHHV